MTWNSELLNIIDYRIDSKAERVTALATVVEWSTTAAMVLFDGAGLAVPVKTFGGVAAAVGSRVGLMRFGSTWTIIGSFDTPLRGKIAKSVRTTSTPTFTTTETLVQTVGFVADPGIIYKVTAIQSVASDVANDTAQARLRWRNATTMTATNGTTFAVTLPSIPTAGRGVIFTFFGEITGAEGNVTVGVTMVRDLGSGNIFSFGEAGRQENVILVEGY